MTIQDLIIGQEVRHKFLGLCYYTEQCAYMQSKNPDPSTVYLYINDHREVSEVSLSLCDAT